MGSWYYWQMFRLFVSSVASEAAADEIRWAQVMSDTAQLLNGGRKHRLVGSSSGGSVVTLQYLGAVGARRAFRKATRAVQ